MGFDFSTGRFFVMGGDSAGTPVRTAYRMTVHNEILPGDTAFADSCDRYWVGLNPLANGVKGHSVVLATSPSFSRTPEVFNGSTWTALSDSRRLQYWYPFNFLLPFSSSTGGRIFEAGPHDTSRTSLVIDGDGMIIDSVTASTPLIGGSAVMYATGKIMKCGTRDAPDDAGGVGGTATKRTQTIDMGFYSRVSSSWTEQTSQMNKPRVNHNLTLLPSGQVLCMGGTEKLDNSHGANMSPVWWPEIWTPATATWGPLLDSTSVVRDYHNTAILLPDSRVLAGGGNTCTGTSNCENDHMLNVFSPPYLYEGNAQRQRPTILGGDGVLELDDPFIVVTDVAVDTIVLMRSGMVTHGFDAGQRIIRPVKQTCSECASQSPPRSKFKLPVDSQGWVDPREVPPGFYQLFAIKDSVPSIGRWVRVLLQSESNTGKNDVGDRSQPSKVTLQSIPTCQEGYPGLTWTAPGDDSSFFGAAKEFDLRQGSSLCSGCWSEFGSATQRTDEPTPGTYGTAHTLPLADLNIGYTYKFQMVSKDDRSGRTSALSNVVTIHVFECDEGMSGGGGGGEFSAHRDVTATAAGKDSSPREELEVTTLPGSPSAAATELLPFPFGPRFDGDRVRAYLRRGEGGTSHVSGVQLVAVDAPAGTPLLTSTGRPLAGTRVAAIAVERPDGSNMMAEVAGDNEPFAGRPGDALIVRLPAASGPTPVVVRALGAQATEVADYGIVVEVPDGAGWREVGRVAPRRQFSDLVVEGIEGETIRLSFRHPHALSRIERLIPASEAPVVHRPAFAAARHTVRGALDAAAFAVEDGITVAARETLTVDFATVPEPASGATRTWYLEVTARHEEPERGVYSARSTSAPPVTAFAFEPVRPNPSTGKTTFEFSLPAERRVRLEVFDLLGRKIATPHDGVAHAGRHVITWDGTANGGTGVRAGLYVCRLEAGADRAERKLLIVP